ncbi:hypothetical protein ACFSFY_10500 [Sporosarcina siberiensis]|uniref:Group-specific protein n=1 Tax=Sporosarcina siberiensis TaxID=1365606 RepID=A0ABW4SH16_9BACL
MSNCKIDHSLEDVYLKLKEQKSFLPESLYLSSGRLLTENPNQEVLNELFHLLKKYDLSSKEIRNERNIKLKELTRVEQ